MKVPRELIKATNAAQRAANALLAAMVPQNRDMKECIEEAVSLMVYATELAEELLEGEISVEASLNERCS